MLLLSLNLFPRMLRILLPIVGLCLLWPGFSQAAEWSLTGNVNQTLGYDDNVRLRKIPQGSFEYRIIPNLTFLHSTEVSEIQANASYGTQVYPNVTGFDRDMQKYGLSGLYKTERFDWGLSTNYSEAPSVNTALQDSGNFASNADRNSWSVSPSVSYKIDELNSIILTPAYSETSFSRITIDNSSGDTTSSFRNNTIKNVNLAWQRLWTERYTSSVTLFYTNFNSDRGSGFQTSYDSVGVNLLNAYTWLENWKLDGTVGVRHTESKNNGVSGSSLSQNNVTSGGSFGFLANIGVNYTGENFSSEIRFKRALTPSNQGQLQEQTGVSLNFNYNITERLYAGLDANFLESTQVNSISRGTREYFVIQPSINWRITPEWTLIGSYRYRTRNGSLGNGSTVNIANANTTGESNFVMLSINYNWQGLKISR